MEWKEEVKSVPRADNVGNKAVIFQHDDLKAVHNLTCYPLSITDGFIGKGRDGQQIAWDFQFLSEIKTGT